MRKSIGIVLGTWVAMTGWTAESPRSAAAAAGSDEDHGRPARDDDDEIGRVRCPFDMPATLNPPADATLQSAFAARGMQIYTCAAPAGGGAPAWTLKAPHAVLFKGFETAAIHFAGPSWQAADGSLVTGTRTASDPGPDPTAIPWLLLQAATNVGPGVFSDVTWIQRLDTEGGAAPATGCDASHVGAQVLVPYRANYFFYRTATAGEKVHQCAAR